MPHMVLPLVGSCGEDSSVRPIYHSAAAEPEQAAVRSFLESVTTCLVDLNHARRLWAALGTLPTLVFFYRRAARELVPLLTCGSNAERETGIWGSGLEK
jgi:hypothetical protein